MIAQAVAPQAIPSPQLSTRPKACIQCGRPFVSLTCAEADAQACAHLESVSRPREAEPKAVYRMRQHAAYLAAFVAWQASEGRCPSCAAPLYEQARIGMATRERGIAHA